ncbi:S24/S26 family peptidase [Natronolimnohabitans innermongolicus]|uniref:Signal peptidase I n=1 Tax=Natronolimnohabitans innermongolicus JCM 12255 TaxID=1227499 RepID=L9XD76_9EURY|nr:S26 family signal peptidase [Natronolimnohabitans innermongolicus]ELY59577.1 signal peptidase I [Natronolimnohabitans innermongolicus JCM 12255]
MGEPNWDWKAIVHWGVGGAIALLVCLLVVGHVFGVPVGLGYVETGSMEPTIDAGDGYVAVPAAVSGSAEPGDVVVYDAQEIDGGGLTTHRVVDETDHGYVTRGDANPVTDQDGNEPHVTDGQIEAQALQINGEVVTIPHLGTAVMSLEDGLESAQWTLASALGTTAVLGTQGLATLLLAFGLLVIGVSAVRDRRGAADRSRSRTRGRSDVFDARRLVLALGVIVFVVAVATTVAMSGSTEMGVVSAEFDSDRPDVIPAGETEHHEYELQNDGLLPVVTIAEPASDGVAVDERTTLHHGDSETLSVAYTAPPETGYYLRSHTERSYFAVLPSPIVAELHAIHPWVATGTTAGIVTGLIVAPFALVAGVGTIRTRSRRRSDTTGGYLK